MRPDGNPDDPDSIYTDENVIKTEKLTVWRTLNVECDTIAYYSGTTNTGIPSGFYPSPQDYLSGLITGQLSNACIIPKSYTPNPTYRLFGLGTELSTEQFNQLVSDSPNMSNGRDLFGNSQDFWTVRIVMASAYANRYGGFVSGDNTIVLRYRTMQEDVNSWNAPVDDEIPTLQIELDDLVRCIILHEIGHVLIDGGHDTMGIMQETDDLYSRLLPESIIFTPQNLCDIQRLSRANA